MATDAAVSLTTEAVPVLDQHRFDEARLERYLREHVEGFTAPLTVAQVQGGMSNPTFILTDGAGQRSVLRKKPPGKLLPSAHAVDREFRVISALWPTPEMAPAERRAIYEAMIAVLATLHKVDYRTVGLEGFGRVGGYLTRQVHRWSQQYEASKTDNLPEMDKLMAWLPEHLPDDNATTIAHGDYRLENLIFHPTEPRVLAVIDWELSTLGAPLADVAYNCLPYHVADPERGDITHLDYASYGIPSEEEYMARYCVQAGRGEIANWNFYIVLSLFRLAAIAQGVYKRGLDGIASSPAALTRRDRCQQLAIAAWTLVERGL